MDLDRRMGDPERICIEVCEDWKAIHQKKTGFVQYSFRIRSNFTLEVDSEDRFISRGDALEGAFKYLKKHLGLRWFDRPTQWYTGKWWKNL